MSFRSFAIVALSTLVIGCSSFQMVGKFDDFNEVLIGNISAEHFAGTAEVELVAKYSGFTCSGNTYPTHYPPSLNCRGQRGEGHLTCSDGRMLSVEYFTKTCTTGWGRGVDQRGNSFDFVFGYDEQTARRELQRASATVASKPDLPGYQPKETRKKKGYATGSGFFITTDGILVTNFHVIDGSSDITIVDRTTRQQYRAQVLTVDPANDFALLRIRKSTTPVPLATQFDSRRGDEVFTLGYPLVSIQGQEQKATFGRVNALSGINDDIRFVQIDVPIQPGNSGGPLFDQDGRVVGIVTATLDSVNMLRAKGTLPQNVNFAVKIDYIMPALRMVAPGRVQTVSRQNNSSQSMSTLVAKREDSVVLVIAR